MMTPDQFALLLRREAIVDELLVHRPVPARSRGGSALRRSARAAGAGLRRGGAALLARASVALAAAAVRLAPAIRPHALEAVRSALGARTAVTFGAGGFPTGPLATVPVGAGGPTADR